MKKMSNTLYRPVLGVIAALLLAACANEPARNLQVLQAELPPLPAAFREARQLDWAAVQPAEAQERGAWWRAFGDPQLDALAERAASANSSIQIAAARLTQARALARNTDADRALQLNLGAEASRLRGLTAGSGTGANGTGGPVSVYSLAGNFAYEVDLFGRLARASEAAALDAEASAALLMSTRLMVQAELAQTYLTLRLLDEERALVRRTVLAYRNTLDLTERRYRAGDVAELEVARVQAEVAETEAEALALDRRRSELEGALAVLVGQVAGDFRLAEADWRATLPVVPPGVPSVVLARRADVAAAQAGVLAAQARLGQARAAWFPSLNLTTSGGYASTQLEDLLRWSARNWLVDGLLSLPVLDGGRRQAGVDRAGAQLDIAYGEYRNQILVALREVEDQLSALRLLQEQGVAQARAVEAATRATALLDSRYRNGFVSQLELLDAQRSELRNRRLAVQVLASRYQATVGLIRALGGGWEHPAATAGLAEAAPRS